MNNNTLSHEKKQKQGTLGKLYNACVSDNKKRIYVRTVGQCFGCESVITCDGATWWTSRTFPLGFRQSAYQAAVNKAKAENWKVAE